MPVSLKIFTDGGARGNPGPAATGVVIRDESGKLIHQFGQTIGVATNNVAEYRAVIHALEWLETQSIIDKPAYINFFLDSKLVVEQLSGHWKIKESHLGELAKTVHQLVESLGLQTTYMAVPRAQNAAADAMVNQALDKC